MPVDTFKDIFHAVCNIFTVHNSSCGKVMFSLVSVNNSVLGVCIAEVHTCQGACMTGVCVAGGHTWQGACMSRETATAVDGTHPTGQVRYCVVIINFAVYHVYQVSHSFGY